MQKGKQLTPSNVLSIARILLLIPIFRSLSLNTPAGNTLALLFMALAVLSDFLDGFVARRLGQITDLGKVLDPVADKICIVSVALFLSSSSRENPFPVWFLIAVVVRESMVISFGYLIYHRCGVVSTSNIWGKATSAVLAALLIVYTLQMRNIPSWLPPKLDRFLIWLSFFFMLVSTFTYARRFFMLMSKQRSATYNSGILRAGGNQPQVPQNGSGS